MSARFNYFFMILWNVLLAILDLGRRNDLSFLDVVFFLNPL